MELECRQMNSCLFSTFEPDYNLANTCVLGWPARELALLWRKLFETLLKLFGNALQANENQFGNLVGHAVVTISLGKYRQRDETVKQLSSLKSSGLATWSSLDLEWHSSSKSKSGVSAFEFSKSCCRLRVAVVKTIQWLRADSARLQWETSVKNLREKNRNFRRLQVALGRFKWYSVAGLLLGQQKLEKWTSVGKVGGL